MKKVSEHHVLPPNIQEENDKQAIFDIIEGYDIDGAIHILYTTFKSMRDYNNNIDACIDACIGTVVSELKESKKPNTND